MAKNIIRISEAEAANDFPGLLARVRDGAEVVIERDTKPVAVVRSIEPLPGRPISESIARAEANAKEGGCEPTLDPEFASDLEAIIKSRKPRITPKWE